jgi:hypothetical protein
MVGAQIGRPLQRFEDFALLTGRGRFADDLPVPAGRYMPQSCARRIRMPTSWR